MDHIKATRANLNAEHGLECATTGPRFANPDPQCKRTLFEYDVDIALDLTPTHYHAAKLPRTDDTDIVEAQLHDLKGEMEVISSDISGDFVMKSI